MDWLSSQLLLVHSMITIVLGCIRKRLEGHRWLRTCEVVTNLLAGCLEGLGVGTPVIRTPCCDLMQYIVGIAHVTLYATGVRAAASFTGGISSAFQYNLVPVAEICCR